MIENIKTRLLEKEFKIIYYYNKLDIINFSEIKEVKTDFIKIRVNTRDIIIVGNNLVVMKLLSDEVLINGNIDKVYFNE